jgi:hypothetical protein
LRRNRFSAASCARGRNADDMNRRTSPATRTIVPRRSPKLTPFCSRELTQPETTI